MNPGGGLLAVWESSTGDVRDALLDQLGSRRGWVTDGGARPLYGQKEAFNLSVAEAHSYFVGEEGALDRSSRASASSPKATISGSSMSSSGDAEAIHASGRR